MYVCVCKSEVNSIRVPSKIGNAPATAPIFFIRSAPQCHEDRQDRRNRWESVHSLDITLMCNV